VSTDGERLPWGGGEPPAEPRLRLIRRRSRTLIKRGAKTRLAPFAVCAAICAAALIFGVLLEQVILAQSAFKLSRIRGDIVAAQARNQELLLESTRLADPERLERYARGRLGMVDPAGYEYIVADVGSLGRRVALQEPSRSPGAPALSSTAATR
jgi:hypothetical protein